MHGLYMYNTCTCDSTHSQVSTILCVCCCTLDTLLMYMFMYIHVHVYLYITYMYTHKNIIAEREARQQIWLRGEKCELVYMCIYTFVCNASGMQLSSAHVHWWKVWPACCTWTARARVLASCPGWCGKWRRTCLVASCRF